MNFKENLARIKARNKKLNIPDYPEVMTEIGKFTYLRTYSRYVPELKRREVWRETVERAVAWSLSLDEKKTTKNELFELFDAVYSLKIQLAGRTLWVGGTEVADEFSLSNFNCSLTLIEKIEDFCDLFYLSMLGSGVGFSVEEEYIKKLPHFKYKNLSHIEYSKKEKENRLEHSNLEINDKEKTALIEVGDSKEGWCEALRYFMELNSNPMYSKIKDILINYDSVRPKGEPLKKFGGFASGHEYLERMFEKISKIIEGRCSNKYKKLESIDILDICNIIGENVVSGGVRRTAQMCLSSEDQSDIVDAKESLYENVDGKWVENDDIIHRRLSNNTIKYYERPSFDKISSHVDKIRYSGEPGFLNMQEAERRYKGVVGTNPCCIDGDQMILTADGYKKIKDVEGSVELVNKDGEVTNGKVWYTGEKEVYRLFSETNEHIIDATADHRFMTTDGETVELKDLKGKKIMPYTVINDKFKDIRNFATKIGSDLSNKNKSLTNLLIYNSPTVSKIESMGIKDVYDFNEPSTNWGVVNGFVTHNCEILLKNKGNCNLVAVDLAICPSEEDAVKMFRLATRHCLRITLLELELPAWNETMQEDRLLGVSITGLMDYKNSSKWASIGENLELLLAEYRDVATKSANEYADELGVTRPKNVTSIKPSGSQSLLGGKSAGVHNQWGKYFIRRIRISSFDPLFQAMKEMGYKLIKDTGAKDGETYVVEFPCKSDATRNINDISAIEQMDMYKLTMDNYTDQNTSCTINVGDDEWDDVKSWLYLNWDSVVGLSFIPKNNSYYPLLPFETINEKEYLEMLGKQPKFIPSVVDKYDNAEDFDISMESECSGGSCPLK